MTADFYDSATEEKMLYCPKCQQNYEQSAQRFCLKDGARLLPSPSSGKSVSQTGGVFSKILNRNVQSEDGNSSGSFPKFSPPAGKTFVAEEDLLSLPEIQPSVQKPLPRIINVNDVPMSQASLGDRKINPTGRPALSWENPNVLLQQTIKNRYLITRKLQQDENSIGYLAEDKLVPNKKVLILILAEPDTDDKFINKIFAEERVSLSHVNHPNVASVIDSGELLEGNPFIITEYVEGTSVKDLLNRQGEFNAQRAARIIRQVSNALSTIHQNGILHRNIRPENIILTVNEEGGEQVKVINFGVPNGKTTKENFAYKSPEQIEGNIATFTSDIYSLAIVAYQMLTGKLPFNTSSVNQLLKSQRDGVTPLPTQTRPDLAPITDSVFEKALALNPSDRYVKARDFGDALYHAANSAVTPATEEKIQIAEKDNALPANEKVEENVRRAFAPPDELELPEAKFVAPVASETGDLQLELPPLINQAASIVAPVVEQQTPPAPELPIPTTAAAVEKKFIEPEIKTQATAPRKEVAAPQTVKSFNSGWLAAAAAAITVAGILAVWFLVSHRAVNQTAEQTTTENTNLPAQNIQIAASSANLNTEINSSLPTANAVVPNAPRAFTPPPNSVFYENNKQDLKGDLLKNYVGFSLYYPKDWTRNKSDNKFLDISKNSPDGLPIEQMLVSPYESGGTFDADREKFSSLAEKSNDDLKKIIPDYETTFAGETTISGDRKAYEVKFQGGGKTENGEKKLSVWGRRLWIPADRANAKDGYIVTMLATSLSPVVTNVNDVGVKGDLAAIFQTFEPNRNF